MGKAVCGSLITKLLQPSSFAVHKFHAAGKNVAKKATDGCVQTFDARCRGWPQRSTGEATMWLIRYMNFYLTHPFLDLVSARSSSWQTAHAQVGGVVR